MISKFEHPNGAVMRMWTSPDKIGRIFAGGGIYERPLLDWILAQGFEGTALDVGANIGQHSLWMSEVCGLGVIAFEPVMPHVVRANAALNSRPIVVHSVALGARKDVGHHAAKGVVHEGRSGQSTDDAFGIEPLDNFDLPIDVSLIKIDVEGMESAVLQGGVMTIRECRPWIVAEEWDAASRNSVEAVLAPLGYTRDVRFGTKNTAPMQAWRP